MSSKNTEFQHRPFEKLKKQIKHADEAASSPPPPVRHERTRTEDELFQDAMTDVQVIEEFRVLPCAKRTGRTAPVRQNRDPDDDAFLILRQLAEGSVPINLSDTQEYVEWTDPAVRGEIAGRLHAGQFSVQGFLDLHGFFGDEVNEELDRFLAEAFRKGWRCVKIIHGRGLRSVRGPVLKDAVARRLLGRYRKQVVSFVSARQCDGGLGAVYVLLRK
jgi:DNA-nicking Smr family endonuclease